MEIKRYNSTHFITLYYIPLCGHLLQAHKIIFCPWQTLQQGDQRLNKRKKNSRTCEEFPRVSSKFKRVPHRLIFIRFGNNMYFQFFLLCARKLYAIVLFVHFRMH